MIKHISLKIYGKVQGVFFREESKSKAETLGIGGFARNEKDGTLYIEAEGEEAELSAFLYWCRRGPARAEVTHVEVEEGRVKGFKEFIVQWR